MEVAEEGAGVDGEEERLDREDETEQSEGVEGEQALSRGKEEGRARADKPLAEEEDGRGEVEFGVGVEVSEGEMGEDGPGGEGETGEGGGLDVEGGGREIGGQCFSDSLCLFKDGGGGRRGIGGAGGLPFSSDCLSGLLKEVCFVSRSIESSCTTTSSTSAFIALSESRGASSHTELQPKASGDGAAEERLSSSSVFFLSSSSAVTDSLSSSSSSSSSSSIFSSESSNPSCARARAIFLRCCRT